MGHVDDILIVLSSYSGGYRLMRARMRGSTWRPKVGGTPYNFQDAPDAIMRVTLSRLKRKGYVENKKGIWQITKAGREHLLKKVSFFPPHSRRIVKAEFKNIIISFDIPETHKKKRNWLRIELLCLGFEMLQRSVWLGPAPLPKEFIDSLHKLQILPYIKFFEAKETDII
ncbi:MAG: hypothetical protein Q7K44_01100 [Candidatus Liptonbacteria bacterium]|nr:hypothetical protein [Candidatus Liptonbacteria bacterium]